MDAILWIALVGAVALGCHGLYRLWARPSPEFQLAYKREEALKTMAEWNKCHVCGRKAEVYWPDGKGDQIGYCGEHEPVESDLEQWE
jgi:hypothetical protein